MNPELTAYKLTLGALVLVFMGTMLVAALFPHIVGKLEMFGLGTITGGLIGLLRAPRFTQSAESPLEREKEDK
jgi:hypothetical protein